MSSRIDDLNATFDELTEKIIFVLREQGLSLDEIKQKDIGFREMREDRNDISSINRVPQSTIEELSGENEIL